MLSNHIAFLTIQTTLHKFITKVVHFSLSSFTFHNGYHQIHWIHAGQARGPYLKGNILLANVQSLENKLNNLRARVKCQRDIMYCYLRFTETWLNPAYKTITFIQLSSSGFTIWIEIWTSRGTWNVSDGIQLVHEHFSSHGIPLHRTGSPRPLNSTFLPSYFTHR